MTFVDRTRAAQAEALPVTVSWESVEDVSFEYRKADLMPRCGRKIEALAARVKRNPAVEVVLDARDDPWLIGEGDPGIGAKRARAVGDALVAAGVPAARIHYTAFHAHRSLCGQATEACYEWNRRVEVFLGTVR